MTASDRTTRTTVDVPTVADGTFFSVPADLPRGRHALPPEQVLAAQRERLMIAVAELLAHAGYPGLGVRDVTSRAKVSATTFYRCYDDLDDLLFAAYDRFIGVVMQRLLAVPMSLTDWHDHLGQIIGAYLEVLDADPVVGRAFQVEMDALGAPARARRRDALGGLAALLEHRHAEWLGRDHAPSPSRHYLAAVYAIRQLAADVLDQAGDESLLDLLPDALELMDRIFGPAHGPAA